MLSTTPLRGLAVQGKAGLTALPQVLHFWLPSQAGGRTRGSARACLLREGSSSRDLLTCVGPQDTHPAAGIQGRAEFQAASACPLGLREDGTRDTSSARNHRTQHLLSGADGDSWPASNSHLARIGQRPKPPDSPPLCRLILLFPEAPLSCTGPEPVSSEIRCSLPLWC